MPKLDMGQLRNLVAIKGKSLQDLGEIWFWEEYSDEVLSQ